MRLPPLPSALIAALALAACSAAPGSGPQVLVAPVDSAAPGAGEGGALGPLDTAPRPGMAKRFFRLPHTGAKSALLRVSMEVPAAWGIRTREGGGRALRPCQVSPSSPSELFVAARPACSDPAGCADHELVAADLVRANLLRPSDIDSRYAETKGPISIARLTGHLGSRELVAFRFVQVDAESKVPVACEAFLFQDEIRWKAAYESACASLRIAPPDWQESPDQIRAAPDGKPRSAEEERVSQAALDYVAALRARDDRAASALLFTSAECVSSGGDMEACETGADARRVDMSAGFDRIGPGFVAGFADVRYPLALPTLIMATVKPASDPCGPGYEVTLARGDRRFAIISAEPVPDPRLAR